MRLILGWALGVISTLAMGVAGNWLSVGADPICGKVLCSDRLVTYGQTAAGWLHTGDNGIKLAWIVGVAIVSVFTFTYVDEDTGGWGFGTAFLASAQFLPFTMADEPSVTLTAAVACAGLGLGF